MKTVIDLEFDQHPVILDGVLARLALDNGIEISVVAGDMLYSSGEGDVSTYEVAMFVEDKPLNLDPWTNVLGWQTPEEITELMREAQEDGVKFMDKLDKQFDEARKEAEKSVTNN